MLKHVGLVILALAVFTVAMPASPVQISYVYSDSMEPTIAQNDGYLVVPTEEISQRDIVVFRSEEREEYVTHRVVGRSEAGLITKGDNNADSDQASGYPHVQRGEVIGTVLTIDGQPVTVPGVGHLVSVTESYRFLLLAGALVLLGSGLVFRNGPRAHPPRSVIHVGDLMHPMFFGVIVGGIVIILTGATMHELAYVAVESGGSAPNTLRLGEATTETIFINATSIPFTHRVVSTDGMTIEHMSRNTTTITADVHIPAPTEPGVQPTTVEVYRYPAVLPRPAIETLHGLHPSIAASLTTGVLFAPFMLLYGLFFDGKSPLRPSRSNWRRKLQRWMR